MPEPRAPCPLLSPVQICLEFGTSCSTLGHSPPQRHVQVQVIALRFQPAIHNSQLAGMAFGGRWGLGTGVNDRVAHLGWLRL